MRTLKVSFHHPDYIYKFKLQLSFCDNTNMLQIDPSAVRAHFQQIRQLLILTSEEQQMLDSFSLVCQKEFTKKYLEMLAQRKQKDYLGESPSNHKEYFEHALASHTSHNAMAVRQLCIYCLNKSAKGLDQLKSDRFLNLLCKHAQVYLLQVAGETNLSVGKQNEVFLFADCVMRILHRLDYSTLKLEKSSKSHPSGFHPISANISHCLVRLLSKLLAIFPLTSLTNSIQLAFKILESLQTDHQNSWIYENSKNQADQQSLAAPSLMKFLLNHFSPRANKNAIFIAHIASFLRDILTKCFSANVNQLLLFVTEAINLRILTSLEDLNEKFKLGTFQLKDSGSICLSEDLTEAEEMGADRQVRLREKKYAETKWSRQLKKGYEAVISLREKFLEFKTGKIPTKNDRKISTYSKNQQERERIRKESFIMTTFEEVQRRYEDSIAPKTITIATVNQCPSCEKEEHESHLAIREYEQKLNQKVEEVEKMRRDNQELIKINVWHQEQLRGKQKLVKELENTIAEFVDVRKKYRNQQGGSIHQVFDIKIQPTKAKAVARELIVTPPPRGHQNKDHSNQSSKKVLPPFVDRSSNSKSFRGSRGSREPMILPPLPPLIAAGSPDINLPLPPPPPPPPTFNLPPPPPFSLPTPPPFSTPIGGKLHNEQRKREREVKIVNWTSVEISKVKDSFWETVEDTDLNEQEILQFFGKKDVPVAAQIIEQNKKEIKTLMKPDRAKNIEIVMKKIKVPFEKIPYAIEELDEDVLTPQNVDALLNIVPTKQEFEEFIELKIVDPADWTVADLFFCLVSKITGYVEILTAVRFKFQFSGLYKEISNKLLAFHDYFERVRGDQFLHKFLSTMLSIGNFMNQETNRGNAYGFRLESIAKTYNIMAQNNKTTLFEYILQVMEKKGIKMPDRSYLSKDTVAPIEVLREDVREMNKLCGIVQEVLLMSDQDDERTPEYFLSFYIDCRQKVQLLDNQFDASNRMFNESLEFYCESMKSESLMEIINEFKRHVLAYTDKKKKTR